MKIIEGVTLRIEKVHSDDRGDLVALEQFQNIPFACERVFFMKVEHRDVVRGGHSNSCEELIVAVNGGVRVEVDNGEEKNSIRLSRADHALWIRPGVLVVLRDFEPQTVLLVCASLPYAKTEHFDRPQPQLFSAEGAA